MSTHTPPHLTWRDPITDPPDITGTILVLSHDYRPALVDVEEHYMTYTDGWEDTDPAEPEDWRAWAEIPLPTLPLLPKPIPHDWWWFAPGHGTAGWHCSQCEQYHPYTTDENRPPTSGCTSPPPSHLPTAEPFPRPQALPTSQSEKK